MNDQGVYNCTHCAQEILVPINASVSEKHEYVDECPKCGHSNVIRVKIENGGYSQVWVRWRSHDEQKDLVAPQQR